MYETGDGCATRVEVAPTQLLFKLNDRPPWRAALLVGAQHVLAMFVGIVTVPLLVAAAAGLSRDETAYLVSMALLASGLSTFIQVGGLGPVGSRLLAVQGTSFAFLLPLIQAGKAGGLPLMLGMSLAFAPVEIILALGLNRLRRVFTPLVSGVVVLLLGLSLIPVGIKGIASGLGGGAPGWAGLGVAAAVIVIVLAMNAMHSPWARMGAVPVALLAGYGICLLLGAGGTAASRAPAGTAAWIYLPIPFKYGLSFRCAYALPFFFSYLVTTLETLGDVTATSQLSGEPVDGPLYWRRVRGGVLGDSVNSMLAALCNSFPNTTFAQNNGIIQLTGIASRRVGYWVGGLLCLLGLLPGVSRWVALIPGPVLGAVTCLLFGFVATAGIRILQPLDLTHRDLLIVALGRAGGHGGGAAPEVLDPLPETLRAVFANGITTGGMAALLLNACLPYPKLAEPTAAEV
jgi:xanthine permease XanP